MKHFLLFSSLLILSLLNDTAESRTWRPQSSISAPTTTTFFSKRSSSPPTFFDVRGGGAESNDATSNAAVPQVPEIPFDPNNLQTRTSNVVRGGSTRTTTPYNGSSSTTSSSSSSSITTTTQTTPSLQSQDEPQTSTIANITEIVVTEKDVKAANKLHKVEEKNRKKLEKKEAKAEKKKHKEIAKKLKNRNSVNLQRKILHASFGFFFATLNHFIPKAKFVPGMAAITSFTLGLELLRYRKGFGWINDAMHYVLGSSLRKHEMDGKFTGSFYYFLGVTITAALYPTSCATLGICQLAIADPTASYFGRATRNVYWSRIENGLGGFGRNKGVLGFLGGALACVPMNYYLLNMAQFAAPVSKTSLMIASFALGFAGAFADLAVPTPTLTLPKRVCGVRVPPFHIDDNVVVPVAAGWACTKVFAMLHYPANLALAKYLVF